MKSSFLLLILSLVVPLQAAVIFTEGFESPAISSGLTTTALPAGWVRYGAAFTDQLVWHPAGTTAFTINDPLASSGGWWAGAASG